MAMRPMYPAVVNSPGTELAEDIAVDAAEITVISTAGLPSAPNLLTIGSDETAETVRYTKVDGRKLSVERGFQGETKSWSAGTRVARYFTAYDHDAFIDNITVFEGYGGSKYTVINPYKSGGKLKLKGQMHCHTTNSDGVDTPEELVLAYKNAGYSFMTITDHNYITPNPKIDGMVWIGDSCEESYAHHVVAYDIKEKINRDSTVQEIIDFHVDKGEMTNLAHPNWPGAYTLNSYDMTQITSYTFTEVYNGALDAYGEEQWDYALTAGKNVFALAVDDCHDSKSNRFNRGWVTVNSDSYDKDSILSALKSGNFISSTGNDLTITVEGNEIFVSSTSLSDIEFIGDSGKVLKATTSTESSYVIQGTERYVRVRAKKVSDGTLAWSNPIFLPIITTDDKVISRYLPLSTVPRKAIMNGEFTTWSHRDVYSNPSDMSFLADRWMVRKYNPSGTHPTSLAALKGEMVDDYISPRTFIRFSVGSANVMGTDGFYGFQQYVENGTKYFCGRGKSVTISFYARCTLPSKRLGVVLRQAYGIEGSGYSPRENLFGSFVELTNNWLRYSITFRTNDTSNKTFGDFSDDYLRITFATAWAENFNEWFGTDSAEGFSEPMEIHITGVQLDEGSVALPYRSCDLYDRVSRYTQTAGEGQSIIGGGSAVDSQSAYISLGLCDEMRRIPTITASPSDWTLFDGVTSHNLASLDIVPSLSNKKVAILHCTTTSQLTPFRNYFLKSNNDQGVILLSAEMVN